ncbi:MAG: hypothetical protein GY869_04050 [Planctomycetes bacterium]|nr:hypothetical protein [Planctomycetota bacterium]
MASFELHTDLTANTNLDNAKRIVKLVLEEKYYKLIHQDDQTISAKQGLPFSGMFEFHPILLSRNVTINLNPIDNVIHLDIYLKYYLLVRGLFGSKSHSPPYEQEIRSTTPPSP